MNLSKFVNLKSARIVSQHPVQYKPKIEMFSPKKYGLPIIRFLRLLHLGLTFECFSTENFFLAEIHVALLFADSKTNQTWPQHAKHLHKLQYLNSGVRMMRFSLSARNDVSTMRVDKLTARR